MAEQQKPVTTLALIEQRKQGIIEALPGYIPADKFLRVLKTTMTMRPEINRATPQSVVAEVMKAAADGLVLDGREAALVIFKVKKRRKQGNAWVEEWAEEAKYIPMVQGVIKRARNTGEIAAWDSSVVYKKDKFKFIKGDNARIEHEPSGDGDPGPVTHAYSIVKMKDGAVSREVMTRAQIDSIAARSRSKDKDGKPFGPWKTDFDEMARKTVIRRHSKYLPVDSDMRRVIERMDDDYDLDDKPAAPAGRRQKSAADKLNEAAESFAVDDDGVIDGEFTETATDPKPTAKNKKATAKAADPEPQPEDENQDQPAGDDQPEDNDLV
jgi:recombination protein RecT